MASPAENILQHFFNTSSLANVSAQQLQEIVDAHPYYGAAHFLLAKKLYLLKNDNYKAVLHKAALHFSNPLWLNYILNDDEQFPVQEGITENIPATEVETKVENEIISTENDKDAVTAVPLNNEEEYVKEYVDESNTESNVVNERLSSMLKEQAAAFDKPIEANAEIAIENTPYHRVDYFDSQGIKLDEEKQDDQLGKKLRRFTDWLKQMKRANPNSVDLGNDVAGETQVQHIAENSNESGEILTEAMAEVLIKQGKPEQAVQIYEKLSFNNPSKSAYFAAKIKDLKG